MDVECGHIFADATEGTDVGTLQVHLTLVAVFLHLYEEVLANGDSRTSGQVAEREHRTSGVGVPVDERVVLNGDMEHEARVSPLTGTGSVGKEVTNRALEERVVAPYHVVEAVGCCVVQVAGEEAVTGTVATVTAAVEELAVFDNEMSDVLTEFTLRTTESAHEALERTAADLEVLDAHTHTSGVLVEQVVTCCTALERVVCAGIVEVDVLEDDVVDVDRNIGILTFERLAAEHEQGGRPTG